jgi:hypothetical protein
MFAVRYELDFYMLCRINPLLGNDSVNTSRDNEYATIKDIRCKAMDVFSALSDPKIYNEKPTVTDGSDSV